MERISHKIYGIPGSEFGLYLEVETYDTGKKDLGVHVGIMWITLGLLVLLGYRFGC